MKNKPNKFVFWTPRVLSIIFVLFLFLMSLDVFEEGLNFWQTALALLMHNIPAIILLIVTIISWKKEIVGGVGFILAGLLYIISVVSKTMSTGFQWYYLAWIAQISGIAFLTGILFLISWNRKNKN